MSEEGICPQCKKKDLSYKVLEHGMKDGEVYYPVECSNCGFIGREYYSLKFVTTIDDEGEEV